MLQQNETLSKHQTDSSIDLDSEIFLTVFCLQCVAFDQTIRFLWSFLLLFWQSFSVSSKETMEGHNHHKRFLPPVYWISTGFEPS